jgi:hypothetical protein
LLLLLATLSFDLFAVLDHGLIVAKSEISLLLFAALVGSFLFALWCFSFGFFDCDGGGDCLFCGSVFSCVLSCPLFFWGRFLGVLLLEKVVKVSCNFLVGHWDLMW